MENKRRAGELYEQTGGEGVDGEMFKDNILGRTLDAKYYWYEYRDSEVGQGPQLPSSKLCSWAPQTSVNEASLIDFK